MASNSSKFITVNPGLMADNNDLVMAFKASALYGGCTVVKVTANTGVLGTLNLALVNYGTSGTVAGGTIATTTSGTATIWVADVPQDIPVVAAQAFVDASEVVYIKKTESASGQDLTADASVCIEVTDGVISQG